MNAIDLVLIVLLVGAVMVETKRGFGRAIFDFAALLITVRIVPLLAPAAAKSVHFAKDAPANEAICFGALFVVIGVVLLLAGRRVYNSTLISLETFDPLLGGVLGLAVALVIGHAVVKSLAIAADVDGKPPTVLTSSSLGMEFYKFTSYHKTMDFLSALPD